MNYGVIAPDGTVAVRIMYDHRVLDGSMVARVLERIEEKLTTDLVAELNTLPKA
jgi:pyruvate/2-oxoglutarate dehydrogenase complex dihydrolipoamide acyltransferase (E2) component